MLNLTELPYGNKNVDHIFQVWEIETKATDSVESCNSCHSIMEKECASVSAQLLAI
jgi:hypothetical protein